MGGLAIDSANRNICLPASYFPFTLLTSLQNSPLAGSYTYLPYKDTGCFSRLVTDYLEDSDLIKPFYKHAPDAAGLADAVKQRAKFPVDRQVLADSLNKQYKGLEKHERVEANIQSLLNENTFTVCTAHQPNLLTGYLYFIYKILHVIKLADELKKIHPDKHFVPVYYMGSEDNDLDELGTFRFRGKSYVWDGNGQHGAVGRMKTDSLAPLLNELFRSFGPPGRNCDELQKMIAAAYLNHKTIGEATQYLVNSLFGRFGLVVINPDDPALRQAFIPVMEDELLHQNSCRLVTEQIAKLEEQYKIQAHPRPVNLFYLTDGLRERIEKHGNDWVVLNSEIKWTKGKLIEELYAHPERFSPNVVLRPLLQETILPNVAFIGGGAEVAYWLQLKLLFDHYNIFLPSIHLRQSVLWIPGAAVKLLTQLDLDIAAFFKSVSEIQREYLLHHSADGWQINGEYAVFANTLQQLKYKAVNIDVTLGPSAEAALAKISHQLESLEKKMLRAEKKKTQTTMSRIERLKDSLFPNNSLQERVENFMEYYLLLGPEWMDTILNGIKPFDAAFLLIEQDV